jgi:hypothetical protein
MPASFRKYREREKNTWVGGRASRPSINRRGRNNLVGLLTPPCPMTAAGFRRAVSGFGDLSVRTDAGLRVHAPEQTVIRSLHIRIVFRQNELPLPTQRGAEIRMMDVEAVGLANHEAPPAFRTARFTAT